MSEKLSGNQITGVFAHNDSSLKCSKGDEMITPALATSSKPQTLCKIFHGCTETDQRSCLKGPCWLGKRAEGEITCKYKMHATFGAQKTLSSVLKWFMQMRAVIPVLSPPSHPFCSLCDLGCFSHLFVYPDSLSVYLFFISMLH